MDRSECKLYKITWNSIHSKEKSSDDMQQQIKNLGQEIDALVIQESSINQSIKTI